LRRVGRVLHIGPSKKALLKAERIPRIGETVVDEKNRVVGTVFDVLGPTISSYVEVDVRARDPQSIVGSFLYLSSSSRHKTGSKRQK